MKIQPVDWDCLKQGPDEECDGRSNNRAIKCPVCGEPWLTDYDREYEFQDNTECPHLKFVIFQEDDEIRFFNSCSREDLLKHVEPATRGMERPATRAVEKFPEEFENEVLFEQNRFNCKLWEKVDFLMVDTILDHTDCGMACGPVSFPVFYGAQLENGGTTP